MTPTCLDDILAVRRRTKQEHLTELEMVFEKTEEDGYCSSQKKIAVWQNQMIGIGNHIPKVRKRPGTEKKQTQ